MLIEFGQIPENNTLHKYLSLEYLIYWTQKEKSSLSFSRLNTFSDKREGIGKVLTASHLEALFEFAGVTKMLDDQGFTSVDDPCMFNTVYKFSKEIKDNKAILSKDILVKEFDDFLNRRKRFHVSCYFGNPNGDESESRYMWDIYGRKGKWPAIRIYIQWKDLKPILTENKDKLFTAGFVSYETNPPSSIPEILCKDNSYIHEKEFRILSDNFNHKQPYTSLTLPVDFPIKVTLDRILPRHISFAVYSHLKNLDFKEDYMSQSSPRTFSESRLLEEEILDTKTIERSLDKLK